MTFSNDYLKKVQQRPERHVGHTSLARNLLRERTNSVMFAA